MDPLTHTLVGANLAACPAIRRVPMATPALVIGANLPDVDVLSYFWGGDFALGFRRGWTHGWPALVLLPVVLWAALLLWDRCRGRPLLSRSSRVPLLALCALAVGTHPSLDWLNTYGMRWWMPLDGTWSYGDSVFIADPWLWALLGLSWWLGKRSAGRRWPAVGLALGLLYVTALVGLHAKTQRRARAALEAESSVPLEELLVGPRPANPLVWDVVARAGGDLRTGRFRWPTGELTVERVFADGRLDPRWPAIEAAAARQAPGFLGWVRFPWLEVVESGGGDLEVFVMDARYVRRRTNGFGGARVLVSSAPGQPEQKSSF